MTAHEVFRIVCGQGGCNPEYFMDRMGISEAREYAEGMMMRSRSGWEQTRMMSELLIKVMTGEDHHIPLPWDDDMGVSNETTEEDLEELRKKAERMEEFLNGKKYSLES
jgi:hypothetical protein